MKKLIIAVCLLAGLCVAQTNTRTGKLTATTGPNTFSGAVVINGSTGLAAGGTGGQTAGGFTTPSAIRHYCGDGTGWRCEFAKRSASTDTVEAWITDGGVMNVLGSYQVNGAQINFTNLAGSLSCAQHPALTGDTTSSAGSCATTVAKIAGISVGTPTGTAGTSVVLATSPTIASPSITGTVGGSATYTTPTLSSPTLTGNALYKRTKATQGTALVIGDVGTLSAGWGTTATVSAVSGTDAAGSITISSSGTGQAANPTFVLTYHDGTWTNSPIVVATRGDFNAPVAGFIHSGATATTVTFGFNGTPLAGSTYTVHFIAVGR